MADYSSSDKFKEGGYGWIIVGVCFLFGFMTVDGYASFGVFLLECVERFGMSEKYLPWIGAFRLSLQGLTGIVLGGLMQQYGACNISLVGAILVVFGHVCCGLFPTLGFPWLLVTYGIIPGIGFGCYFVVIATAFQDYFHKKTGLANAIVSTGISTGIFVWCPLIQGLFSHFGWTGGLIMNAALHLHGLPLALILRHKKKDLSKTMEDSTTEKTIPNTSILHRYDHLRKETEYHNSYSELSTTEQMKSIKRATSDYGLNSLHVAGNDTFKMGASLMSLVFDTNTSNASLASRCNSNGTVVDSIQKKINCGVNNIKTAPDMYVSQKDGKSNQETSTPVIESTKWRASVFIVKDVIDVSLFKNVPFLLYCLGLALAYIGQIVPLVFLPARAVSCGISRSSAAFLVSILGICNVVGRLFWGNISDIRILAKYKPFISGGTAILDGITSVVSVFAVDYISFAICASLWGVLSGGYTCLQNTLVVHILHGQNVNKGAGTLITAIGISWFLSFVFCGLLIDMFGNQTAPFLVFGGLEILGGILISSVTFILKMPTEESS